MATYDAPECKPKANEKPTTAEPSAATDGKKPLSALRGSMPFLPDATEQELPGRQEDMGAPDLGRLVGGPDGAGERGCIAAQAGV